MSARSFGTHLSLSPMSARPVQAPKKGATAMVTPLNINYVPTAS